MEAFVETVTSGRLANLAPALAHTLWQAGVLAVLLWVTLRLLPARRANLRYGLCVAGLGTTLLCGIVTWAILNRPAAESLVVAQGASVAQPAAGVAPLMPGQGEARAGRATEPRPGSLSQDISVAMSGVGRAGSFDIARPGWRSWAALAWMLGVIVMLGRAGRLAWGSRRLRRSAKPVTDAALESTVERLRQGLGMARRIGLAVSERLASPAVVGLLWPTILVPPAMLAGIPPGQLAALLAHELAHVRRYDYLVNLCQLVIEALLFFNPAVWWLSRQVRIEREACCDALAARATGQRVAVAEALVDWVARSQAPSVQVSFAEKESRAMDRVRRLVTPGHRPRVRVSWASLATFLLVGGLVLGGLWRGTALAVEAMRPAARFQVLRPDGTPLANTTILMCHQTRDARSADVRTSSGDARVTTDANGCFRRSMEFLGQWRIGVLAAGTGYVVTEWFPVAEGQDPPEMTLQLKSGAAVSGRVVDLETSATVAGAEVYVSPQGAFDGIPSGLVKSDANGAWQVPTVPAGSRKARVNNADTLGYLAGSTPVETVDGRELKDVVIKIERGVVIRGMVLAADEKTPVAGATIAVPNWPAKKAMSDAKGKFAIGGLQRGQLTFSVTAPGYAPLEWQVEVPQDKQVPEQRIIMASRGGTITGIVIDGDTGKPRAGQLVAAVAGKGYEQFFRNRAVCSAEHWESLKAFPQLEATPESRTDAQGHFELKNVPVGEYVVIAFDAVVPLQESGRLTLAEGQTIEAALKLVLRRKPPGWLTGRLLKPDGLPLAKAEVRLGTTQRLADSSGSCSSLVRTDAEGRYYLSVKEGGSWTMTFAVAGYRLIRDTLEAEPMTAYEKDFTLTPEKADAEISGKVLMPDGQPAAGVTVMPFVVNDAWPEFDTMSGVDNNSFAHGANYAATTGADGSFRIIDLRPGRYGVLAQTTRQEGLKEVPLRPELAGCCPGMVDGLMVAESGRVGDVRIQLLLAAKLAVTVVDGATGKPLPGAQVRLDDREARSRMPFALHPERSAVTDAQGQVQFQGLMPVRYGVTVWPPANGDYGFMNLEPRQGPALQPGQTTELKVPLRPNAESDRTKPVAALPDQPRTAHR